MHTIFIGVFVGLLILLIISAIRPGVNKKTGKPFKRKEILPVFGVLAFVFLALALLTYPKGANTKQLTANQNNNKSSQSKKLTPKPASKVAAAQPDTSKVTLTGFGATQDEWNKTHTVDTRASADSSYNPGSGLTACSNFGDRYYGMTSTTDYNMCFPSDQPLATTQGIVMKEFPADATILWQGKQTSGEPDECYQMEIHSAILGSALGTDGNAFVEFETLDPNNSTGNIDYQPSNVNDVLLNLTDNSSLSTAPGC